MSETNTSAYIWYQRILDKVPYDIEARAQVAAAIGCSLVEFESILQEGYTCRDATAWEYLYNAITAAMAPGLQPVWYSH